jgi:3-hydroxyacyl-CoA dehydrogenase/3-hydroxy-2-methylbutyryl-CoA dehydrogenase
LVWCRFCFARGKAQEGAAVLVKDAVVVVTGGASGLGAGVAEMVQAAGGRVIVFDLPAALQRRSPGASDSDTARFVGVDIAQPDQVLAAVEVAGAAFGRIDALVSCAGIGPAQRMIARDGEPHPLDVFRRTLEVNLIGLFDVLRLCAARMATNPPGDDGERGVIVNMTSISAFEGEAGQAAYAASKGGIAALTLTLARDLGRHGIRVNALAPGIIDTPMLAGFDESVKARVAEIPVFPKRLGRPDEVADAVRFCIETPYLNGEIIRLDAGVRLAGR